MLDMTPEQFEAFLADAERSEWETDHQNRSKGELEEGYQNPCKPQKQKENGGASAGFIGGIVGHLVYNEQLARASSRQKDDDYKATRGGAQYESQGGYVPGEFIYPISPAPSESNKRNPEVSTSTQPKVKRPESSRPNVGRPQASRHNAQPSQSFFHGLATAFLGPKKAPRSYLDAQQQGTDFTKVPKRRG